MPEVAAAVWHAAGDVRVEPWTLPERPPAGWVRLRVAWCGICGSDTTEYRDGPVVIPTAPHPLSARAAPLVLGHEIAGTVVEVGSGVSQPASGQHAACDALIADGHCDACLRGEANLCSRLAAVGLSADGGLAELVDVPANSCFIVPDGVGLDVAAVAEPLAVAVRAAAKAQTGVGEALILGAGSVGTLLALVLAQAERAPRVSIADVAPGRARAAHALSGATPLEQLADWRPAGSSPVVAFECTGSAEALNALVGVLPAGSRIVLVGVHGHRTPTDLHGVLHRELEVVGSLAHSRQDFATAVALLPRLGPQIEQLITHRVRVDDVPAVLH